MATSGPTSSKKPKAKKLSRQQMERRRESRRAAQARYRERNREAVLEAGRERSARRRAHLKTLDPGNKVLEGARAKAREAGARYREQNREELALKQRQVRKRAYIRKHGLYAHIQRRFDAPIAVPESDSESEGGEEDLSWGPIGYDAMAAPLICDYYNVVAHAHENIRTCAELEASPAIRPRRRRAFLASWANSRPSNPSPFEQNFPHLPKCPPPSLTFTRGDLATSSLSLSSPLYPFSHLQLSVALSLTSLLAMIHCVPPYYPSPSHESRTCHDNDFMCVYYAVFVGRVRGVYTNNTRADGSLHQRPAQGLQKKWAELELWWRAQCAARHRGACPAFETVNFTLDPPTNTHPSTPACNRAPIAPVRGADDPTIRVFALSPQPKREDTQPSLHLNLPPRDPLTRGPPANAAERGPRYYGIRGVSVFYHTHAAASEPHIMVSRDVEKLERWMLGEPFKEEDEEVFRRLIQRGG
ncbi:hypothetical protein GGX14DRAFT_568556 [Mycena pura]|uniref:Uncharacterized protein n=1 Tax=Mycena pura TaxID=153505 RepID=A0AAD6Y7T3_9AGAR|nr:hypothetical protein GGX14DRAFT_568556 [Mycena pura]